MAGWFYVVLLLIGIILFTLYSRMGKLLRCILFTACTGLPALAVLWGAGQLLSITVALTPLSMLIAGLLGVPGIVAMLVMNLL